MARKDNTATQEVEETQPITPSDIADATGADPKAVRAYLRSNFARDPGMKGKSWNIPSEIAAQVIEHFTATEDDESEELEEV